jgi:hypothetical protein
MRGMKRSQDTTLINKIIQENWVQESMFVLREEHAAIGIGFFLVIGKFRPLASHETP